MGITPNFTRADVRKAIKAKVAQYRDAVNNRLQYAGEQFISLARSVDTYTDRTGNLRNSIGYMILYNGKVKAQSFGTGGKGPKEGKKIAKQIALEFPSGFVLVGVAGMNYAAAVEARGKDVITGSSQEVETLLKRALRNLNKNFNV
ncbi:MAG: hypothetical protein EOO20_12835 [Chryseobacterium sp.]|nr:MAG: hypothetical protein EOO20_12835 [Chryseobacterium sp.]